MLPVDTPPLFPLSLYLLLSPSSLSQTTFPFPLPLPSPLKPPPMHLSMYSDASGGYTFCLLDDPDFERELYGSPTVPIANDKEINLSGDPPFVLCLHIYIHHCQ